VKKITTFLMNHGLSIMLVGFLLFFVSFLVILFAGRYYNFFFLQAARAGALIGLAFYVTGRVSVFFHNKRKKQLNDSTDL